MKIIRAVLFVFLSALLALSTKQGSGQDTISYRNAYPEGISAKYGLGNYAVKDRNISNERYTGMLPMYGLSWAKNHGKYVYLFEVEFRNSDQIKNNNVTTDIYQLTLNQGFLYPIKDLHLFDLDLFLWLGPSARIYVFNNHPDIAAAGFSYSQSVAGMLAAGFNGKVVYPINKKFGLESSLSIAMLSLGFRSVDTDVSDELPVKFLTVFSGLNSSFELGGRYYFFDRLSLNLAYRSEVTHITPWERLLSVSDNVLFGMTFKF